MAYEFYLGLDLSGRRGILTLVEKASEEEADEEQITYRFHRLEQLDKDTSDEEIVEHIQDTIADRPYTGRSIVVVNKTGKKGQAVLEALTGQGLTPIGVSVTEGDTATQTGSAMDAGGDEAEDRAGFFVSRRALIGMLQDIYDDAELELIQDTPEFTALLDALDEEEEQAAQNPYVISAALACWFGEQHEFNPLEHLSDSEMPTSPEQLKPGVRKSVP